MNVDDDTKLGDLPADDGDAPADEPQDVDLDDGSMMLVDGDASCEDCSHKGVCAVYGNFNEQVAEQIPARTGGDPAFEPEDLAMICGYYDG